LVMESVMKVLVVEDDPLIREFAAQVLLDEGFAVIEAENGEQALEECSKKVADILFTDIRLPGVIDGWHIAEECRKHDPTLPVIYATAFSPVPRRAVPGSIFLRKPYQPDQVVRAIRQLFGDRTPNGG
jgi:CheY-like chemotaxis protein